MMLAGNRTLQPQQDKKRTMPLGQSFKKMESFHDGWPPAPRARTPRAHTPTACATQGHRNSHRIPPMRNATKSWSAKRESKGKLPTPVVLFSLSSVFGQVQHQRSESSMFGDWQCRGLVSGQLPSAASGLCSLSAQTGLHRSARRSGVGCPRQSPQWANVNIRTGGGHTTS